MRLFKTILICGILACANPASSLADITEELGGTVEAEMNGKLIHFPALKTDVKADIQGDLATVKIIQIFENPTTEPMHARYLFPMNKDSAVYAMTMEVGDEIIRAKIKRKEEAKATFEKAKKEGKAASLLTQHRPNMFTQKIANLMPGMPVKITLQYTQVVPKIDNAYELVVPLVVGPRYNPPAMGEAPDIIDEGEIHGKQQSSSRTDFGTWELEDKVKYPEVTGLTLPDTIDAKRVAIKVNLNSDIPLQAVFSKTHNITVKGNDKNRVVTIQKGRVIDNADFVLRYSFGGEETQAGFLTAQKDKQSYFSLMIEPPSLPDDNSITAREMVFVLDTSGSMSGQPIEASKIFMRHALENLRAGDYFRIIRFGNDATEYSAQPMAATKQNLADGLSYIESLYADGGTNIPLAVSQAFSVLEKENTIRIVVFLTDGYIGNEASVLQQIAGVIGDARIYAFGVGSSVNRYLLSEMGRRGRGFARFIDPTEDVNDVAISLAKKLNAPVLTDIEIDWGKMKVSDVTPDVIPDLFAGDSIRIQGRYEGKNTYEIHVNGLVQGQKASLPLHVSLLSLNDKGKESIPLIWARSRIADYMRHINTPENIRSVSDDEYELKEDVVKLGLNFSLMTKWTSFVAVSEKTVNKAPEKTAEKGVAVPMVKGVTKQAYANNFSGGSVPEPATTGGLVIMGGAAFAALRRRRKKPANDNTTRRACLTSK